MADRGRGRSALRLPKILAPAAALCLLAAVGGSYAWMMGVSQPVGNTITLGGVAGDVDETTAGGEKTDLRIQNTGSLPAFVRVAVVAQFKTNVDPDNPTVSPLIPVEGDDYDDTFNRTDDWVEGLDGFWYYTRPVAAGALTPVLLNRCRWEKAYATMDFSYEVYASLIQASPAAAAEEWSNDQTQITVNEDGTLRVTGRAKGGAAG